MPCGRPRQPIGCLGGRGINSMGISPGNMGISSGVLTGQSPFLMGKSPFFMGKSQFLMGKSPFLMGKSQFLMGKSQFLMGKSTISMVMFNSYVRFDRLDMFCFVYLNMVHDTNVGGWTLLEG